MAVKRKYSNSGNIQWTGAGNATAAAQSALNKQAAANRAGNTSERAAEYRGQQAANTAEMVKSAVALAGGPLPGNFQALLKPKATPKVAVKPKAKPKPTAVARRVGIAGPVAPPVDPLDTLRGEYDKYLTDMYAGLQTTLKGDQEQYKVRSQELADRLKANYDDAANVAGTATKSTQDELAAFAQRMGLQQATQGQDVAGWEAQNQRLKALNEVNRASSASTNDTIRSNYYDFLGDKVASARGQEATSRATLNDLVAQAKLARLQAQQAAAAAAARARSSRGRGGGGSGGVKGSTSQTTASTNDELNQLFMNNPAVRAAMLQNDPISAMVLQAGKPVVTPKKGSVLTSGIRNLSTTLKNAAAQPSAQSQADALAYYIASAKAGGPKTSSKTTNSVKR